MSYEVKSGKKRPWQEANSMEADTETNTQKTMSNIHNILPKPIRKLRLEAIFHPKFDNENLSDQKIRNQMIERIEKKLGYLEVTLKHSGSLVLWSGDQRYYSKNSTGNQFTFAAEILLRQHFERAWRQDKEITSSSENRSNEHRYEECSRFLQENRLTLAFEVVTAVLGDHGDTPHKDFVMLTAVADRSQERFYATTEIIQLAHKFRLPHNDSWMFATYQSVNSLFQLYDSTRETAMAQATVQALNKRSCAHVKSMYQHDKFQGEILEGIIIRYIPYTDKQNLDGAKQLMDQLAFRASEILTIIPSDLPQSFQVDNGGKKNEGSKVFCANIRQISQEKGGFRGQESENPFEDALMEVLGAGGPRHEIRKEVDKCVNIPSLTEGLRNSKDRETKRIAKLLEMLSKLNKAVSYSIVQEDSCDDKNSRCLCVIHIHDDRTFQSYHERIDKGSMHLFRGFCIEMSSESTTNEIKDAEMVDIDSNQINVQITESEYTTSEENPDVNETKPKAEKFLMLKMKFLPYIVRTFLCRNKLQVLRKEGAERFNRLVKASLDRLEISYSGRQKWIPFLESWALYVQSCWNHEVGDNLPPLIESNYLVHLKYFSKLYKQGKAPIPFKPKFRGVALVLSVVKENAKEAADCIAERLEANSVELSKDRLILGNVCYAELELSPKFMKVIKQELFAVSDCSAIILYGCNDEDAKLDLPHEILNSEKTMNVRLKQIMGRSQKMKQQDCAALIELSKSTVMKLEDEDADSNEFDEIIKSIQVVAPYDRGGNPPGALVFFSSIPGCGKSTILHSMDAEIKAELAKLTDKRLQNLEVYVREGDKIGKLFWIQAKKDRRKDTSCIFIADKNAPPPSWKLIGSHCSETNGVPIAVLPDPSALKTTHIKGVIYPDGNASSDSAHFYPFSLTYLAICMARVLKRPAKSHPGKLDSGVPNVCMVVISFFCLYRHKSAEDLTNSLEARLQSVGAPKSLEPISVPFFKKSANLDLPTDLSDLLEEALRLQVRC
jgi:DNA-binding XRE family transcriptional regulator